MFLLSVTTFTALPAQSSVYVEPATEDIHVGDVFLVELKANIQEPIISFQMYLDWDDTMFAFHGFSVEESALPGILPEFVSTPDIIQGEEAKLSISWFPLSFQAVEIDSGAVVLSFWLEAIDCGTSSIGIVPTTFLFTEILAEDASGNLYNIDIAEIDATVEISCDTLPDPVVDCENPLNCVEQITVELSDDFIPSVIVPYDSLYGAPNTNCVDTSGLHYSFDLDGGTFVYYFGFHYACDDIGQNTVEVNAVNGEGEEQGNCEIVVVVQIPEGTEACDGYNQDRIMIEALDSSPEVGDTVAFALRAFIDQPIISWRSYINWDTSAYTFVGLDYENSALPGLDDDFFDLTSATSVGLEWFDAPEQPIDISNAATIFVFYLKVLECDPNPVVFDTALSTATEVISEAEQAIELLFIEEQLSIPCGEGPVEQGSVVLRMPDTVFMPADTTCVPVIVDNFEGLIGMQFPISYDPDLLMLTGIQNVTSDLPSFNQNNLGPIVSGNGIHNFRVFYVHPLLLEQSLPDSTVLFEVCFTQLPNITEAACSELGFKDFYYDDEFVSFVAFNEEEIPYQLIPSQVSIASNLQPTLCEGESMMVNNQLYDQNYPQGTELIPGTSCDSTLMVNLQFLPNDTTVIEAEIAPGEAFQVGNETFNQAGDYEVLLTNRHGCDSLVYLNLDVLTAAEEATSTLSLDGLSLQQLLDDAPTRFPENELRLFDALGRQVYYAQPYDGRPLNITTLPSGVYYYTFRPAVGEREVLRGATVIAR